VRGATKCDSLFGFRLIHRYVNEPIPITDPDLLGEAHEMGIYIDEFGMFPLTNREILEHPMTWVLTLFFTVVVTPGWGIKLGTVVILNAMFRAPPAFAAQMTAIYMAIYALGRLFGGYLAQYVGSFIAYDILVLTMLVFLAISPLTGLYMDHGSSYSAGCETFMVFICVVGLVVRVYISP
jgi:nitrate/nitrite transporter NarK